MSSLSEDFFSRNICLEEYYDLLNLDDARNQRTGVSLGSKLKFLGEKTYY